MLIVSGKVATKKGRNRCKEERSKIKLICNRVIHESEIVCRYLNSTLQQSQRETQVRSQHINSKRHIIRIQIHG
jgi:hypothetical protein